MKFIDRIQRGLGLLDRGIFQLCGVFMLGLTVIGAADVVLNNTIGYGAPGAIDIAQALFVCCVFLALPFVVRHDEHIKVDLFTNMFSVRGGKFASAFAALVGAATYFMLAWTMYDLFRTSWRVNEQSLSVVTFPIYPVKFLAFVGLALACVAALGLAARILRSRS